MKRHKDLLALLKSNGMRVTAGRRELLQFILDNGSRRVSLGEIHAHMDRKRPVDRASIYRNLEAFKKLEIVRELKLPGIGKCFEYVLDRKVHHFYVCKVCGRAKPGDARLFDRIEAALKKIHGFVNANLSVTFYGTCAQCARPRTSESRARRRRARASRTRGNERRRDRTLASAPKLR
jgi:Fur family ferric uptake transcriptional regulator